MISNRRSIRPRAICALFILSIVGAAACSGTSSTAAPSSAALAAAASALAASASGALSPSDSPSASTAASASTAPVAAPSDSATAVPTSIDPCQLITADEAGKLAGATFGKGKESTTEGNARICTYGAQTTNVFNVEVAIAPDVATAKAAEGSAEAELQKNAAQLPNGLSVTKLPNFAPGADAVLMGGTVALGGVTIGGSAIYVLRGTTFFGFSDIALRQAPPSAAAMKSEAMTLLGKLP